MSQSHCFGIKRDGKATAYGDSHLKNYFEIFKLSDKQEKLGSVKTVLIPQTKALRFVPNPSKTTEN